MAEIQAGTWLCPNIIVELTSTELEESNIPETMSVDGKVRINYIPTSRVPMENAQYISQEVSIDEFPEFTLATAYMLGKCDLLTEA